MLGLLAKLIALPVTGPIKGTIFLAEKLAEHAEKEMYNADTIQAQLMELELRYDLGEISEEAYYALEEQLLDMLKLIRKRNEEGT